MTKFTLGLIGCFFETLQAQQPENKKIDYCKTKILKKKNISYHAPNKYKKDGLDGLSTSYHLEQLFCK